VALIIPAPINTIFFGGDVGILKNNNEYQIKKASCWKPFH
jgi:hypothetical protein